MKEYKSLDDVPPNDVPAAMAYLAWRSANGLSVSDEVIEPLLNRQKNPQDLMAELAKLDGGQ